MWSIMNPKKIVALVLALAVVGTVGSAQDDDDDDDAAEVPGEHEDCGYITDWEQEIPWFPNTLKHRGGQDPESGWDVGTGDWEWSGNPYSGRSNNTHNGQYVTRNGRMADHISTEWHGDCSS